MNIKAVDVQFTECYIVASKVIQRFEFPFFVMIVNVVSWLDYSSTLCEVDE